MSEMTDDYVRGYLRGKAKAYRDAARTLEEIASDIEKDELVSRLRELEGSLGKPEAPEEATHE